MKPMKICLWFEEEALEAARFYVGLFPDGSLGKTSFFTKEGFELHHRPEGSVMSVDFHANGMDFVALNGRPDFKFNEVISLVVLCESQEEIDHYWKTLSAGGITSSCGWLKDRYGLSWQITPAELPEMLRDQDESKRERVTSAFMAMQKFNLSSLRDAYRG